MKQFLMAASLLTLCACNAPPPAQAPASPQAAETPAASTITETFACANGVSFTAALTGDDMAVTASGQTYHLHAATSSATAAGQTYTDGHVEFWEHQDMGSLSNAAGGPYEQCQLQIE